MSQTAVTLARSGSKGLPNKNILKINDVALSHYAILAAEESSQISTLVYSSDSNYYLDLANNFYDRMGFKTFSLRLHLRSSKNSTDKASSWDAVKEVMESLPDKQRRGHVTLLSATCPSLKGRDIDLFFNELDLGIVQSAISVREVDYPIENTFFNKGNFFTRHQMTSFLSARQESQKVFRPDGHIYLRLITDLSEKFPDDQTQLVNLNKEFYFNIDSENDFKIAKSILESGR